MLRHPTERGEGRRSFDSLAESALTGTMSALTLLLVALLKNSELRAERAMQLKDAVRLHEEL